MGKPPRKANENSSSRNTDRSNDRGRDRQAPNRKDSTPRRERGQQVAKDGDFLREEFDKPGRREESDKPRRSAMRPVEKGMERFRLEVGSLNDVKPGNIVGAIANEAGIDSQYIGQITIEADHSLIDLPEGMPKEIFSDLKKTRVCGVPMKISRLNDKKGSSFRADAPKKSKERAGKKPKAASEKSAKSKKKKKGSNKDKGKRVAKVD